LSEYYGIRKRAVSADAKPTLLYATKTVKPYLSEHEPASREYFWSEVFYDYKDNLKTSFHDYIGRDTGNQDIFNVNRDTLRDREIRKLQRIVKVLLLRLEQVENQVAESSEVTLEVAIKETTIEEARPIVKEYLEKHLKKNKAVYPSDVADALGLRYETVQKIFANLVEEGQLQISE
jgi:hypothetical protein